MPRTNPFVYGSPIAAASADAFADRTEELGILDGAFASGANVILLAPRRYGKTSLLNIAVARAIECGVRAGRATLADCTDLQDVCESLLHGILEGPARWRERGIDAVHELVGHLRPRIEISPDGTLRVGLDVSTGPDPWRRLLHDVLRVLDAVRAGGEPVVLVIDEFQRAYELDAAVPGVVKRLCDEMPGVSLVLSGSRRHLMERISGRGAPLARVGTRISLPKVPRAEMCDFLVRRAVDGGRMLGADVAERIHDLAAGVPNEVQQLASHAFDHATGNRVRAADVDAALARIVRQGRFEYVAILRSLAPSQQRLLRQLARGGPQPRVQTGLMVRNLRVSNPSAVRRALTALEEDDLVEQTPDGWEVSNPFLALWLRDYVEDD
jgi:hypothetical protein